MDIKKETDYIVENYRYNKKHNKFNENKVEEMKNQVVRLIGDIQEDRKGTWRFNHFWDKRRLQDVYLKLHFKEVY